MTAYVTKTAMITRFGEARLISATDRSSQGAESIDDAILAQAIADAGDMIDSYLGKRYALPLSNVPTVLERHAATIAFYFLCTEIFTDQLRKDFEDSKSWLNDISTGKAVLDAAGVMPESAAAEAEIEAPPRIFSREKLCGY